MDKNLKLEQKVQIMAPVNEVWDALVNPEKIKQYLFGTNAVSDWQKGSTILFKGEWQGKPYEDKGIIKKLRQEEILEYEYWSAFMGLTDKPENYSLVTFKLEPIENGTLIHFKQEGFINEKSRDDSAQNWEGVLETLKSMLEA